MLYEADLMIDMFRLGWLDVEQRIVVEPTYRSWLRPSLPPPGVWSPEKQQYVLHRSDLVSFETLFMDVTAKLEALLLTYNDPDLWHSAVEAMRARSLNLTAYDGQLPLALRETHLVQDLRIWFPTNFHQMAQLGGYTYFYALQKAVRMKFRNSSDRNFREAYSSIPHFSTRASTCRTLLKEMTNRYDIDSGFMDHVIEMYEAQPFELWDGMAEVIRAFNLRIQNKRHSCGSDSGGGKFLKSFSSVHQSA